MLFGLLIKVEELRRDLRIKSQELEAKNAAANDKLKKMVKDQQEAEKKKVHAGRCHVAFKRDVGQLIICLENLIRV